MAQGSTSTRVLNWFVRAGTLRLPDGTTRTIGVEPLVIGRDDGAQVVVVDREVSALHCELRASTEGIVVKDLGSTNGTFIGSVRVREAVVTEKAELLVGQTRLTVEPTAAKERVDVGFTDRFGQMVGQAPPMRRIFSILEKVAASDLSILILGETGTGKEVVAKSVHQASPRKNKPFVVVDCGSIPETLAESLLFGHEKGSFTGASERKMGALAEANGGTLFLDELGELPLEMQPKLLRALSERQVRRVGASQFEPIDVRVVAATRRDLGREMNAGRFRSDLFFRIAQVRVEMPALRERLSDVPALIDEICARSNQPEAAAAVRTWVERRLGSYDWPGNVRELVNVVQVAATLAHSPETIDDVLSIAHKAPAAGLGSASSDAETAFAEAKRNAVSAFERDYFTNLVRVTKGNVSEMARKCGMERHHVRAFLRKYGIDKES